MFEPKRALIQQRQVGLDAPDMVSAIQASLVQNADLLFVGEIRDLDTLAACLTAPESGRLVLTQLHQPTPEAAVRRITELAPAEAGPTLAGSCPGTCGSSRLRCCCRARTVPGQCRLMEYWFRTIRSDGRSWKAERCMSLAGRFPPAAERWPRMLLGCGMRVSYQQNAAREALEVIESNDPCEGKS